MIIWNNINAANTKNHPLNRSGSSFYFKNRIIIILPNTDNNIPKYLCTFFTANNVVLNDVFTILALVI